MQKYIGTKIVNMQPMTRAEYNVFRGWQLPDYLVEYTDGGKPNTAQFAGYVSWSPKEQADAAYRETTGLTFGLAVEAMKKGAKVARAGWNGANMFAYYVPAASYPAQTGVAKQHFGEDAMVPYRAYIALKTADGGVATWAPSGSDALAEDWLVIE